MTVTDTSAAMTASQRAGMIAMHEKMARAFDSVGMTDEAETARTLAARLKAKA